MDHPLPPPPRGSCSNGLMGFGDGGGSGGGLSSLMIMPSTFMASAPLNLPLPPKHNQNNNSSSNFFLSDLNSSNSNFNPCGNNNINNNNNNNNSNNNNNQITSINIHQVPFNEGDSIKSKIMSHPLYPRLLSAYISCHKVGAPPEVVAKLEETCNIGGGIGRVGGCIGEDPALDQFMEAYCEMLTKYEQEISKPFKEAMVFFSRIESQFKSLTLANPTSSSPSSIPIPGVGNCIDRNTNASSDDDGIDMDENFIDPQAEDQELKGQLLRKYSGYLGSLKKEFLKKRKKGKLPKEARQQLLDWWTRHLKWPYPSESQKMALAESTGLDPKQINNWFINQRKRHWKPTEEMQFVVMDATAGVASHPSHYYMDNGYGGGGVNPFTLDCGAPLF